jgi:hypothetical protein
MVPHGSTRLSRTFPSLSSSSARREDVPQSSATRDGDVAFNGLSEAMEGQACHPTPQIVLLASNTEQSVAK